MKLTTRKCKNCGTTFQKLSPLHSLCSPKCAIAHSKVLEVKRERSEKRLALAETREKLQAIKPLTKYAHEAQAVFNQYIRERDKDQPCISCGTTKDVQYCAGHFRTRGAAGHLRFNEDNVHRQCNQYCNLNLSGNLLLYRENLIKKIGIERVSALENNNQTHKWTKEELIQIKQTYKQKLKQLKAEL
jgi:hypothetical protein